MTAKAVLGSVAAILLTICRGGLLIAALSQPDSSMFVMVEKQQLPTSGVTTLQNITSKSTIGCGKACLELNGQACNGFVFQKTMCDVDSTSSKSGTCQLLAFSSLAVVSMWPSANTCDNFYVRRSLLSNSDVTTTTIQPPGFTSSTPLASTSDVTTTKVQSPVYTSSSPLASTTGQVMSPKLSYTIQGNAQVAAVTLFDGQLYLTRAPAAINQISVYNVTSFQLMRYITVPGATGNLYGLVVSPINGYLYVSDYDNNFVHRVNLSSTSNSSATATKWSVATKPNGMSINRQLNLLVASESNKIQEYTSEGLLVRQISDGSRLNGVMEVNDGNLAISRYGPMHGVALISVNGTSLYSYGSTTTGTGSGQMYWPGMLTVDSQGFILVADSGNNRILVLNPTLSQARAVSLPLAANGQLRCPFGVWLDESHGWLFVGECSSPYRVLVFDNVFNLRTAFTP